MRASILFKLHPALIHAGGSGDPDRPLAVALASTPDADTTVADWGSTLATAPALGTRWNLDGPGMPRRSEPTRCPSMTETSWSSGRGRRLSV